MNKINTYLNIGVSRKINYLKNYKSIDDEKIVEDNLYYYIYNDLDIVFSYLYISPSKYGYRYWKDAIFLYIESDNLQVSICNDIYPMIAEKYNKSSNSVERAMRLCFQDALYYCSKNEDNFIMRFLRNYLTYPRNSEIMAKISEILISKEFQNAKFKLLKSFNS